MIIRPPVIPAIISGLFLISNAYAESNGIHGYSTSGTNCSTCHTGGSYNYYDYISVSDSSPYEGQTVYVSYTLNNNYTTSRATYAGYNLSASGGNLYEYRSDSIKESGQITHNAKRATTYNYNTSSHGDVTWGNTSTSSNGITWNSSSSGSYTLYACSNPVNNNGASTGDGPVECDTQSITVYNRPVVGSWSTSSVTFTEGTPRTIDTFVSMTADSSNLNRAEVYISSNYSSSDRLVCPSSLPSGISCSGSNTRSLTLSGSSSKNNYNTAIEGIQFNNVSQDPTTSSRSIRLRIRDTYYNYSLYSYKTLNVTAVNDTPTVSSFTGTTNYTENGSSVTVDSSVSLSDVDDSNLNLATIQLTTNYQSSEDSLICPATSLSCSYSSGTITLSGTATKATYDSAIQAVRYINSANDPSTSTRTVRLRLRDASNGYSGYYYKSISITASNDIPTLSFFTGTASYTENASSVLINSSISISDLDDTNLNLATVGLTTNFESTEDSLVCPATSLNCSYNSASGLLTFSNSASIATYDSAIQGVRYLNSSDDPSTGTRSVRVRVRDAGNGYSSYSTKSISVTAINDAPTISSYSGTSAFTEDGAAIAVDNVITLSDLDHTSFNYATMEISANYSNGNDVLNCPATALSCSFNSANGILTLSGTSSISTYDAALQSITFQNNSDAPDTSNRTVRIRVRDTNNTYSGYASKTVTVAASNDAPLISNVNAIASFSENGSAVIIDNSISLSDADHTQFNQALVEISGNYQSSEDTLICPATALSCSYSLGTITFSGTANIATYQSALQAVTYNNTSENPNTGDRTIRMRVRDTSNLSSAYDSTTLQINGANDAPVMSGVDAAFTYTENDAPALVDSNITITDIDSSNLSSATVTIFSGHYVNGQDVLTCPSTTLSCSFNTSNGVLTLSNSASIAIYESAMEAVTYHNTSDNPVESMRRMEFQVTDTNSAVSNIDFKGITVVAVNDSPVITQGTSTSVVMSEDANPTPFSLTLNATDAEGETITWSVNTQASNGSATATGTGSSKTINYTPTSDYSGADSFIIQASDSTGNVDTITVNVTVTAQADSPVITEGTSVTVNISEDNTPGAFALTLNASDADGSTLTWSISSAAANGSAGATGTGTSKAITYTPDLNFNGSDSFIVSVSDGSTSDTITVNVNIAAQTDSPIITEGTSTLVNMSEDNTPSAFALILNASDADNDTINWSISSQASNGSATATGTGASKAINYTPNTNYNGSDSFVVSVTDGNTSDTIIVNVNIAAQTDAPVITEGTSTSVQMSQDGVNFQLTLNATDADNDTLTWSISSAASNGTAGASGTGASKAITYTPTGPYIGLDSFIVRVSDGAGGIDTITINVTVAATLSAPNITEGESTLVIMSEDSTPSAFSLTLNATDPNADTITWSISSPASNGSTSASGTGASKAINYTPTANYNGSDSFVVNVNDGNGNNDTITVNVTVQAQADAPVITEGTGTIVNMSEDSIPTAFALTLNASDVDADTLNWSISSAASNGTAIATGSGNSKPINYTPNVNYNGSDSFVVSVDDGTGNSDTFTVTVNIAGQSDTPVITEGTSTSVNISEDNSPSAFALTLNATDTDGDTLIWSISSPASNGTASTSGTGLSKAIAYTPTANFNGSDSFIVNVNDGNGNNDTITVNVNIAAQSDLPVITEGANTAVLMSENASPTPFNLTLNAADVDGDSLTWSISSTASNGTASASGTGASKAISYTPETDYNGADSFIVNVNDGNGNNDTITVNVTVSSVANPPVITEGTSTNVIMSEDASPTAFELTLNATDADGDTLTWSINTQAGNGTASASGTGLSKVINYIPASGFDGADSFIINVADGTGNSDNITVNVTVNPVNDAPIITEGVSAVVNMSEDSTPTAFALTLNATDPESDTLSWSISTVASHGTASASGTGNAKAISYTPDAQYNGTDMFEVRVSDGEQTDLINITVNIGAQSDAPIISQGASVPVIMSEDGTPSAFNLILDASDNDNDTLNWSIISAATNGTATATGTGASKAITYAPTASFNGIDTFTVGVNDGTGNNDSIVVNVTINAVADAPAITEGDVVNINMSEDGAPTAFSLILNASDNDNDTITWSISSPASNGSANVSGTGASKVISYTPTLNYSGSDSFVVQVSDGGITDTTIVNVTVNPENDAPIITEGESTLVNISEDNTPTAFALTLNATDADADTITWSIGTQALNGEATATGNGASKLIAYTPNTDFNGADSFIVSISDGNGNNDTITVNVNIAAQTDAPVITEGASTSVNMSEDNTPAAFALTLNASDTDGDNINWSILSQATNGSATATGSGTSKIINYTPTPDYAGSDSFVVEVDDGTGNTDSITVTVTINNQNDAPVISEGEQINNTINTTVDSFLSIPLNASDLDGDTLNWSVSTPANGTASPSSPSGNSISITYTPDIGYNGPETYTVTVTDGNESDQITINTLVSNGDFDNDTVADNIDNCPGIANTGQEDADGDSTGDVCDDDDDNDGINDQDELNNGLNPLVASTIIIPADVTANASGFYTEVDEGNATIIQGDISVTLAHSGNHTYRPGVNIISWLLGSAVLGTQNINIIPLINFYPDQLTVEGTSAEIKLSISGNAITYPVTVNYSVAGTADNTDHDLVNGSVIFNALEITKTINVNINSDALSEGTETIVVSLDTISNAIAGANAQHTLHIVETNITPTVNIITEQNGLPVTTLYKDQGSATITAIVTDPGDTHSYSWINTGNSLLPPTQNVDSFIIDMSTTSAGLHKLSVDVSDGEISVTKNRFILIEETAPILSNADDTDNDTLDDAGEGLQDSDGDFIPDYLDGYNQPGIIGLNNSISTSILQTGPGLIIQPGQIAVASGLHSPLINLDNISNHGSINGNTTSITDDNYIQYNGIFDFEISGLFPGDNIAIIIPLNTSIRANSVIRKYSPASGWQSFISDETNNIYSATGSPDSCPEADSGAYTSGLTPFDYCIQLVIEDGGPNDADGTVNGIVVDPSTLAIPEETNTMTHRETDACSDNIQDNCAAERGSVGSMNPLILSGLFLLYITLITTRKNIKYLNDEK